MTRLVRKLLLPFTAVLVLAWAGLVLAQNSQGGSFLPGMDYIIGGQWTWRGTNSPWVIEGTTDDAFESTITFTQPTADRTITFQNATGTVALGVGVTSAGVASGSVMLDGANPTSVTTGLTTLLGCDVKLLRSTTPGLVSAVLTIQTTATAGQLDIYAWDFTSSSNPTLVAGTTADAVSWFCNGTR